VELPVTGAGRDTWKYPPPLTNHKNDETVCSSLEPPVDGKRPENRCFRLFGVSRHLKNAIASRLAGFVVIICVYAVIETHELP
jgi:hypothetical protein